MDDDGHDNLGAFAMEILCTMLVTLPVILTDKVKLIPHRDMPPSTMISVPVMKLDSSEPRNSTA